jgi:hypothetical protein
MIPSLIIAIAVAAVCGFLCLALYRLAEAIRNYRPAVGSMRRVAAPAVAPQTGAELEKEVADLTPHPCPHCGAPMMPAAKMCENCGYTAPINFRTARTGWPSKRRQLENENNPPTLPKKQRSL